MIFVNSFLFCCFSFLCFRVQHRNYVNIIYGARVTHRGKMMFLWKKTYYLRAKKEVEQRGYYGWGKYWHSKLTDKLEKMSIIIILF